MGWVGSGVASEYDADDVAHGHTWEQGLTSVR